MIAKLEMTLEEHHKTMTKYTTPPPHTHTIGLKKTINKLQQSCKIINISILSHDVASCSDITPCNKIDKPLLVYRLDVVMLRYDVHYNRWQNPEVFATKMRF